MFRRTLAWILTLGLALSIPAAADVTFSGLPAVSGNLAAADIFPADHSGVTSKVTMTQVWTPTAPIIFAGAGTCGTGSQTYICQDNGATAGLTFNVPTSSTNGFNFEVNNTSVLKIPISGIIPIAGGGTGSATQNFVDLSTGQTVAGIKTFSSAPVSANGFTSGSTTYKNSTINGSTFFPYKSTVFTSSGTFTTPADGTTSTIYRYRLVGAGGGGGGVNGSGASSGGGGAGGYGEGSFTGVAASTGITITVGALGAGGASTGAAGGTGGTTTIGTPVSVSCAGGGGAPGSTASTFPNGSNGGGGGTCSGAPAVSEPGANGGTSMAMPGSVGMTGKGAASAFGDGGASSGSSAIPAPSYGSGGSGAFTLSSSAGGNGGGGLVIIERMTP